MRRSFTNSKKSKWTTRRRRELKPKRKKKAKTLGWKTKTIRKKVAAKQKTL